MFRGFYTVGSGMIAQQRRTELLANNLANAQTPGFKAEQSTLRSFPEMLISNIDALRLPTKNEFQLRRTTPIGPISTGVYMQETLPLHTQGKMIETGLPTDFALVNEAVPTDPQTGEQGAFLYRLENDNGQQMYTRNGNFSIDAAGYLTHPMGYYVLDTEGERIQLPNDDVQVAQDGTIYVGNTPAATIGVAYTAQPSTLLKQGNGFFVTEDGANLEEANGVGGAAYSIRQGFLEGSNVDPAQTMTDMLTAYRAFEANQKILQAYDRSMEKAVNEIGRVN